ncbi:spore germination protein (amino acid permease) [Rossellomorea marisflavi]
MMNRNKRTQTQLVFFIIQTQIGVGILGLPYNVFLQSKQDGWISVLIAGLIVQVIITYLWFLAKRFPKQSLFEYSKVITGKYVGTAINMAYITYGVLVTALILMYSTKVIKTWMLIYTPKWIIMMLLILTAIYLAREHVDTISNIYVLVSMLIVFLLVISFVVMGTYPIDYRYLFPIGAHFGLPWINGAREAYFSMLGFELILILYHHFHELGSKAVLKSATLANWVVTIIYMIMMIVSTIVFSPVEIAIVPEPVLYFVKSLNLQIVERIDLVFLSLWIVNVVTSLTSYLFLSIEGSRSLFKKKVSKKKATWILFIYASVSFSIAVLYKIDKIDTFNHIVMRISYALVCCVPLTMLIISLLRKKESGVSN